MKQKIKKFIIWLFVMFCVIAALVVANDGNIAGCLLLLIVAVVSLPIKQVQKLRRRIFGNKPQEKAGQKKRVANTQGKKIKKNKRRHMAAKPAIIAIVVFIAIGVGLSDSGTDETYDGSQTAYVETSEQITEAAPIASVTDKVDTITPEQTEEAEETEETDHIVPETVIKATSITEKTAITEAITSKQTEETVQEPASEILTAEPTTEQTQTSEASQGDISSEYVIAISEQTVSLESIPAYSGSLYADVNENVPYFTDDDLTTTSYEYYSDLDSLGRCGVAVANIGQDIMPTEERGAIGSVKPTGWHTVKYDIVDGKYLYNRCHLIGYQLSGENANEKNLITGTRYLNVEGMLPFENMVADYVKETGNHVLYRVTPIFEGDNLLASGVLMEAMSVEDDGDGILFCVYCYNVQPGVGIDYATGDSWLEEDAASGDETDAITAVADANEETQGSSGTTYILNTNTKKFHYPSCNSVDQMSEKNKQEYTGSRDDLISQGYSPCGNCNP